MTEHSQHVHHCGTGNHTWNCWARCEPSDIPVTCPAHALVPRYIIRRAPQRGGVTLYHATDSGPYTRGPALCGAKPGRKSAGWSDVVGPEVSCPRCVRNLGQP